MSSRRFFSGFGLSGEEALFDEYSIESPFVVSGFSYGAQKALLYANNCDTRVDLLQLFSPAFFGDRDEKFKRAQLLGYAKNGELYMQNFYQNISKSVDLSPYFGAHSKDDLFELLYFSWEEPLKRAVEKNIKIEVFLGERDCIIDSKLAATFFKNYATTFYFKGRDHMLREAR